MVAGRDPDHAAPRAPPSQRGELVQHPARLERARLLEELGLQPHLVSERPRAERRRAMDPSADALGRLEHVVAGQRHARIVDSRRWTTTPSGSPSRTTCGARASRSSSACSSRSRTSSGWSSGRSPRSSPRSSPGSPRSSPAGCRRASTASSAEYVRYATHLGAYVSLAANPYPELHGEPGYPVDVSLPEPRRSGAGRLRCGSSSRSRH